MIDLRAAREIVSKMSPLPWLVLEEENGEMTIIRNPNHPIHSDGLDAWGRREDAERPDALGIAYMRAEFPAALDEIDRLREALIEERAGRIQESRSGDFLSNTGEHIFCIVDMEECRKTARQQLEAEGKI